MDHLFSPAIPADSTQEMQAHQRKLMRLTGALRMVMARVQKMRRTTI